MFQRVLLPTDGSRAALAAVEGAVRACAPGGEILLLAVIPPLDQFVIRTAGRTSDVRSSNELADAAYARRKDEARADLDVLARAVEDAGGRIAARLVEDGEPGPRIVNVAHDQQCDVIVMSTNGRTGWKRAILGSVADYVVRNSENVPVMLVRHREGTSIST